MGWNSTNKGSSLSGWNICLVAHLGQSCLRSWLQQITKTSFSVFQADKLQYDMLACSLHASMSKHAMTVALMCNCMYDQLWTLNWERQKANFTQKHHLVFDNALLFDNSFFLYRTVVLCIIHKAIIHVKYCVRKHKTYIRSTTDLVVLPSINVSEQLKRIRCSGMR